MATNEEVIESFITKSEEDSVAINLFTKDGVLYSYGLHWPLAVWCPEGHALINATRRSRTSTIHVGLISKALTQANVEFKMSTMEEVKEIISGE